jgi:uncharacterized protein YndB with AHSA1/START domain
MVAVTGSRSAVLTFPTDDQILVTREFDAPAHLVYRACTEPELVKRWWHAKRGEVTVAEMDLRVGGKWRFAAVTTDGFEVAFHGEILELIPNERVVQTEAYEGAPDAGATTNTMTLEEHDGRTTLTVLIQCPSKEVRDAIVESGMEDGLQDAYDLLEEVAQSLN